MTSTGARARPLAAARPPKPAPTITTRALCSAARGISRFRMKRFSRGSRVTAKARRQAGVSRVPIVDAGLLELCLGLSARVATVHLRRCCARMFRSSGCPRRFGNSAAASAYPPPSSLRSKSCSSAPGASLLRDLHRACREAYTTTNRRSGPGGWRPQEGAVDVNSNASFVGGVECNVSRDNDFSLRGNFIKRASSFSASLPAPRSPLGSIEPLS